ncbi:unnamed protein product, partial [Polarella glacialis]
MTWVLLRPGNVHGQLACALCTVVMLKKILKAPAFAVRIAILPKTIMRAAMKVNMKATVMKKVNKNVMKTVMKKVVKKACKIVSMAFHTAVKKHYFKILGSWIKILGGRKRYFCFVGGPLSRAGPRFRVCIVGTSCGGDFMACELHHSERRLRQYVEERGLGQTGGEQHKALQTGARGRGPFASPAAPRAQSRGQTPIRKEEVAKEQQAKARHLELQIARSTAGAEPLRSEGLAVRQELESFRQQAAAAAAAREHTRLALAADVQESLRASREVAARLAAVEEYLSTEASRSEEAGCRQAGLEDDLRRLRCDLPEVRAAAAREEAVQGALRVELEAGRTRAGALAASASE